MSELIEYTTACRLAEVFRANSEQIREKLTEVKRLCDELAEAYGFDDRGYTFGFDMEYRSRRHCDIDTMLKLFKITAWQKIIEHTGIRKVMSAKRQDELDKVLHGSDPSKADTLPDISEETIMGLLKGYASSANEFLEEAVDEIYDWAKPYRNSDFKTNQKSVEANKLERKVIKEFIVEGRKWTREKRENGWNVRYEARSRLMALDNIFHILDGSGAIQGHRGPFLDAIEMHEIGETEYFRFKGFKNGNLHIEFKRQDLLDRFNAICGRDRLGDSKAAPGHSETISKKCLV